MESRWHSRTKQDLIIEVWEALDCESVGTRELVAIQGALRETLGAGAVESPAAIARAVADEGAVLRHPEILECDKEWRLEILAASTVEEHLDFSTLATAAQSLRTIEERRREAEIDGEKVRVQRLRETVMQSGREVRLIANSKIVASADRAIAKEIAEWIRVWLEQPALFADWLALRQRSPEYLEKFG